MGIYKTGEHAAKAFATRYELSMGGGWFQFKREKIQGLGALAKRLHQKGCIHPFDGSSDREFQPRKTRVTMHFEFLDPIFGGK